MKDKLKRYAVFLLGLFISSLGVSLVTKAKLGTSPISSIPYVLSLNLPFSLGEFTIFFSIFLILLQLLILRKNFKAEHLLQIPISIAFGYFIDITMLWFDFLNPQFYVVKMLLLLCGCLVLGLGVYLEVIADVAMLPGESFVRAIVQTWKKDFGTTKVCFDVTMSVTACVLSFLLAQRLEGVREGTIIAALLVGFIARLLGRWLGFIPAFLFGEKEELTELVAEAEHGKVLVIGRQYGSGGHDLGKKLAEKMGFAFYDSEIIEMAAGTTGFSHDFVKEKEERLTNSLLYDLMNQMYGYSKEYTAPKDAIFEAESKAIQEIAEKGNCVIIGRCADYILRNKKNCLKVFLHAPEEMKLKRVMEKKNLDEKAARQKIYQEDKRRSDNYRYYTGRVWGHAQNYDLTMDASFGEAYIETIIEKTMNR